MAAEQPNNIKKPCAPGCSLMWTRGRLRSARRCSMKPGRDVPWGGSIIRTRFWIPTRWNAQGASPFFPSRRCWKRSTAPSRWWTPRPCRLFRRSRAHHAGAGLRRAGYQRHRRRAGHTLTLWRLLERYQVPTFLFLNKMDLPEWGRRNCWPNCGSSSARLCGFHRVPEEIAENAAMCDEALLENYLETGGVTAGNLRR